MLPITNYSKLYKIIKMKLSKENLKSISTNTGIKLPYPNVFSLPEKVLQFGTGVFVRGLIDYLIDKANNQEIFNGRVVVVKSTNVGNTNAFKNQDNLYTLVMKSVDEDVEIEETVVCAAISRVLSASDEWSEVLNCASNPQLQIIISNTTEVGISMVENDPINANPPVSFPSKLLSFLYERYKIFNGSSQSGMVIIPTELIPDNATKLKDIVNTLAWQNGLDPKFITWLSECNDFCNSLVDRIVPGKLPKEAHDAVESKLGYEDDLMIMSETFALWAIETDNKRTKELLSFREVHPQIYVVPDIGKFRELKLRLLNGSHNLSCAVGFIARFNTVRDSMVNPVFGGYMQRLILDEIAPSIVSEFISLKEARQFGAQVLDRYRNPHIEFEWLSICVQDTSKIKIRAVPIVVQYYEKYGYVPHCICIGFAAYILFMKCKKSENGTYIGQLVTGKDYIVNDDFASNLAEKWASMKWTQDLAQAVLGDRKLWDIDLSQLKGFAERIALHLDNLITYGAPYTIDSAKP